ncbi:MAG: hypothetical protein K2M36_00595 [Clostridia bacterium]|nr:hypothetical protein [Clostridia bacterium]
MATVYVVRVAFMAAMLTAFKFALSAIPNVEVVTLMIIVYGSAMGIAYALPATFIFCAVEIAIYGAGSWVLLYFIYFPMLAVVASLLLKGRRLWLAVIIGIIGSVLFGVLSACCDTLFCISSLAPKHMGQYWVAYYLRGLYFDITHVISSVITISVLYTPLVAVVRRCAPQAYGANACGMRKYQYAEYRRTEEDENNDL